MTVIVTERPHHCTIRVWHGEDWYDPIPQLVDPITGDPYDLTDVTLELIARPTYDHANRFLLLTSDSPGGIEIEDAANGLAAIFMAQADVESDLPISNGRGWEQFMRLSFIDADLGAVTKLFWTGPLIVFPAKDDATP